MSIREIQEAFSQFCHERDWEQFHSPKNLVMALSGEVGELTSIFQWIDAGDSAALMSGPEAEDIRDEIGDIVLYLLRLAEVLDLDLAQVASKKLQKNRLKYPVETARGSSTKYTRLGNHTESSDGD